MFNLLSCVLYFQCPMSHMSLQCELCCSILQPYTFILRHTGTIMAGPASEIGMSGENP